MTISPWRADELGRERMQREADFCGGNTHTHTHTRRGIALMTPVFSEIMAGEGVEKSGGRLDYRGKMILAPMVKVILALLENSSFVQRYHELSTFYFLLIYWLTTIKNHEQFCLRWWLTTVLLSFKYTFSLVTDYFLLTLVFFLFEDTVL